jgi:hypothetical protein
MTYNRQVCEADPLVTVRFRRVNRINAALSSIDTCRSSGHSRDELRQRQPGDANALKIVNEPAGHRPQPQQLANVNHHEINRIKDP